MLTVCVQELLLQGWAWLRTTLAVCFINYPQDCCLADQGVCVGVIPVKFFQASLGLKNNLFFFSPRQLTVC